MKFLVLLKICVWHCLILYFALFVLAFTTCGSNSPPQELPGEHDDFESMRAHNKIFVDKSEYLLELVQSEDRFFRMCRPGRFGKSSFLQMVKAFFQGRKELFEGLQIYGKHDWRSSFRVVLLDFSAMNISSPESFGKCLEREIERLAKLYAVEMDEKLPFVPSIYSDKDDSKIGQLLDQLMRDGRKIVLLIDEYDWPLRKFFYHYDYDEALGFHEVMMEFFRQFERRANQIEFLFFTCTTVTPWHRYYRLSHDPEPEPIVLRDISFDPTFSQMVGLTGKELKSHLKAHINAVADQSNATSADFVQKLKKRYNGYCFSRNVSCLNSPSRLYNFHSVMSCLRDANADYLWHPAGDPKHNALFGVYEVDTFRRNYLTRYRNFFKSDGFTLPRQLLEKQDFLSKNWKRASYFEGVKPRFVAMGMLRHGYVTIQGYNEATDEFTVNFPNDEMRESYRRATLELIFGRPVSSSKDFFRECNSLRETMLAGTADDFFARLLQMISRVPHKRGTVETPLLIDEVFQICHFSCSEVLEDEEGMKVDYLFYTDSETALRRKTNPQSDGLEVTLSRHVTNIFKFEFKTSAIDAMNAALGMVNEQNFRKASQNRTTHIFGININESGDWINDWMKMTYKAGKLGDVQASSPLYVDMYRPYTKLESYSPLTLPTRKYHRIQF